MGSIGRTPLTISSGRGAEIVDVDGNAYIDYVCSWGPLIHGHAHPEVIDVVCKTAERGTSFGAPTELETKLAEEVVDRLPSVQMVRMVSSGTEASMSAVRLARGVTGREKILKFIGTYHGHVDGLLAEAGSGLATQGIPASPGVPQATTENTVLVQWNSQKALSAALNQHKFAAVIVEPFPANMGLIPPSEGFLQQLRSGADSNGALLIFDEVISGFRVAYGGAQELAGVTPDITVFGKIVGGGLPAAGFGASTELMQQLAPVGSVYQAGTLSGNPVSMAAGLKTLQLLDRSAYQTLAKTTDLLVEGIRSAAKELPVSVVSVCGLLTVFFRADPPTNYREVTECNFDAHAAWCRELLLRGIYPPPSQYEAWFPSLVHSQQQIQSTVSAVAEAFNAVADRLI